jgi:siroheme synthase
MTTVHVVGGFMGGTLDSLPVSGLNALHESDLIIFPGTWMCDDVRRELEPRLLMGRHLTCDEICAAVQRARVAVLLYGGDPLIFTGIPAGLPSALELVAKLELAGAHVRWHGGTTSVNLAMTLARLELSAGAGDSLRVAAPLVLSSQHPQALETLAADRDLLALLWCEDRIEQAWVALMRARGPDTRAHLVATGLDGSHTISSGTLVELSRRHTSQRPPAVLLVEPPPRPSVVELVPVARLIASMDGARIVWLVGLPASGKSTLLELIREQHPTARCIELADVVNALDQAAGFQPGGLLRNGRIAAFIRAESQRDPEQRRWFVAAAALPVESLPTLADERLVVLDVPELVIKQRLERRPHHSGKTNAGEDLARFVRLLQPILALPHATLLSNLIKRTTDDDLP